ncbi:MAG: Crp/Fnr family transcriptional regulator [Oscillospiraceae bacterium]|jgi:CRP-like cAMP-binding protein|nr:Crp/Fnr family transcriptional regulator [Oscillospiraceae bacterium]
MKELRKTKRDCRILSGIFLFRGTDKELSESAFASPSCTCAEFETGEQIYTRMDFQRSIGIVLSGGLKAVKGDEKDGQGIVLNTFESGDVFGAAGLFGSSDCYVSEIAAVRCSRVLFLPQSLLRDLFYREPRIAENYISFLSGRIRYLNTCIDHFTGGSAEVRLAQFLFTLEKGEKGTVKLPYSLTQLSDTLGIGRASLYRAFHALTEKKLILRNGRLVEILDLNGLRNVCS